MRERVYGEGGVLIKQVIHQAPTLRDTAWKLAAGGNLERTERTWSSFCAQQD